MHDFQIADHSHLKPDDLLRARDLVLDQMAWARQYTIKMAESFSDDQWFDIPDGGHTNLAWQIGHLAVAQYGLMLFKQRGRTDIDRKLMPGWLRKKYARGTTAPDADNASTTPSELLDRLLEIDRQSRQEVAELDCETLAEETDMPFASYPIKLGALMFCPIHESIHAGQIGMLRRQFGMSPIR